MPRRGNQYVGFVTRAQFEDWIDRYERAWRTPGTDLLAGLFSADASYLNAPFQEPFVGLDEIAKLWERQRDAPDEIFAMEREIVAVDADTGVSRMHVRYGDPVTEEFKDIWIVRLGDDGLCTEFEEWPFSPASAAAAL
jgi:hypothetical protein